MLCQIELLSKFKDAESAFPSLPLYEGSKPTDPVPLFPGAVAPENDLLPTAGQDPGLDVF